jgi:hypothetical protein
MIGEQHVRESLDFIPRFADFRDVAALITAEAIFGKSINNILEVEMVEGDHQDQTFSASIRRGTQKHSFLTEPEGARIRRPGMRRPHPRPDRRRGTRP